MKLLLFFSLLLAIVLIVSIVEAQNAPGCLGGLSDASKKVCAGGSVSFTRTVTYQVGLITITVDQTGPTVTSTTQNVCQLAQQSLVYEANCRRATGGNLACVCTPVSSPGFKVLQTKNCCEIWGATVTCQTAVSCS